MTTAAMPKPSSPSPGLRRHLYTRRATRVGGRAFITALYLFLLAPILVVAGISFDTQSYLSFPPQGFTLDWYARLAENEAFVNGFKVSVVVAGCACLVSTVVGVPAAIALARRRFRGRGTLQSIFVAPLMVPTVVLGLALLLTLTPPGLTGTYPGLVIAHLAITTPYVIRTTAMSLLTADTSCEEAARILGANNWRTFRRVTLPLARPGILAGAAIAFLISFDEAVISLFVVGPNATTLPVEIFNYVQYRTDPQVAALSVVLIVISLLFVVIIERVVGLRRALR
jgi:putative spermidine/putrescine transport system permease protein